MDIPEYTLKDFTESDDPYKFVHEIDDPFDREQAVLQLSRKAKDLNKDLDFRKMYEAYAKRHKGETKVRFTEFTGQPVQLKSGDWICDDRGVRRYGNGRLIIACQHPILPTARLVNIDTGDKKIEVAFKRPDGNWRREICDAEDLSSKNRIIHLSRRDIGATSSNAAALVDYLRDLEQLNYNDIPQIKSANRMGWVGYDKFIPYASDIAPDSTAEGNRYCWSCVKCSDTKDGEQRYMDAIKEIRAGEQIIPRIALAASLASVLVQPCGLLPFICHLWGKTGTGKTVTLMLAASVWGAPAVGQYTRSCNATQVGLELLASTLNNLPLILDELQTISNKKDFEDTMYELTEGTNRSRGSKTLEASAVRKWSNCTITSGEQPITSSSSGGGVVNRIIDLPCNEKKLFPDPVGLAALLRECYGYLGKRFVELLYKPDIMEEARSMRESAYSDLVRGHDDIPEKQAQSASLIITADYIVTRYIIQDKYMLTPKDLFPYIADPDEVDAGQRAYDWVINWISSQRMHFFDGATDFNEVHTEVYGLINPDNTVTVISSVFKKACTDAGFNPTAFKRWLKEHGLSVTANGRLDKSVRVDGTTTQCVVVKTAEAVDMPFVPVEDGEQQSW